jgi:hypothetical protein
MVVSVAAAITVARFSVSSNPEVGAVTPSVPPAGMADGRSALGATRDVALDGLVFSVPLTWTVAIGDECPGSNGHPRVVVWSWADPVPPLGKEPHSRIGCSPPTVPFVLIRSLPDAQYPGSTERIVNGLRVRVHAGPPVWGVNFGTPAGWSIHHAVFPARGAHGVLLQVASPPGSDPKLFERILASVRPGTPGDTPGTRRVAFGGVSFEVPRGWRVVGEHSDPCGAVARQSGTVFLGTNLTRPGCNLPDRYLEVQRLAMPRGGPTPTSSLNGFRLQLGFEGREVGSGRQQDVMTAELVDPPVRLRLVATHGGAEGGVTAKQQFDAVLLTLQRPAVAVPRSTP